MYAYVAEYYEHHILDSGVGWLVGCSGFMVYKPL